MFKKKRFLAWAIAGCITFLCWAVIPVSAQFPLPSVPSPTLPSPQAQNTVESECVRVDGRCLFKVTAPESQISERVQEIEERLETITNTYFRQEETELNVEILTPEGQNEPEIYVQVGGEASIRLMSVTSQDAELTGDELEERAREIAEMVQEQLQEAKAERKPELLVQRGIIAAVTVVGMVLVLLVIYRLKRRSRRSKRQLTPIISSSSSQPVSTQLSQQQQWNLKEIQHRLLQLVEVAVWLGGILFILGLFPYTRPWQVVLFYVLRIPLRFAIAFFITYLLIRVSFVLIDRLTSILTSNYLLTPEADRRLQLRVSTISGVTKGVVTALWIIIGFLVGLSWVDVDIGPLLAGAGILGLAVSFASQNLIKDALNGFFIILEDQYAIGDIISVADVSGLVENINLRITQLRDAEGRLITIPNSEIKIVANLSSNWSRADITVPVNYRTDIDSAIALINEVAETMTKDTIWREQILEPAQVLGVDNFGDRGLGVRVWIKTQPLKQWDVSREFRRRIKVALDEAGITIPVAQQELWFNSSLFQNLQKNGKSSQSTVNSQQS